MTDDQRKHAGTLVDRVQDDDAIRVRVGKRLQRDAVDSAEDRAVQADAERQTDDRRNREARIARSVRIPYRMSWKSTPTYTLCGVFGSGNSPSPLPAAAR